ncbi:MAG: hypothetical protein CFE27_11720 [Alphaproteobacteria bacterium PA1]|nr:MAG: hypothetical protein CFE27_11720 [Alphaproteobacteria bacterium PA1]
MKTNKKWLSKVIGLLTIAALSSCDWVPFMECYDLRVPWNVEIEQKFTDRQNQTSQKIGSYLGMALVAEQEILKFIPEAGDILLYIRANPEMRDYEVRLIQEAPLASNAKGNDRILRSKSKLNCGSFPEFRRTQAFLNTMDGSQGLLICISNSGIHRLYSQVGDVVITPTAPLNPRPKTIQIIPWNAEYELE